MQNLIDTIDDGFERRDSLATDESDLMAGDALGQVHEAGMGPVADRRLPIEVEEIGMTGANVEAWLDHGGGW